MIYVQDVLQVGPIIDKNYVTMTHFICKSIVSFLMFRTFFNVLNKEGTRKAFVDAFMFHIYFPWFTVCPNNTLYYRFVAFHKTSGGKHWRICSVTWLDQ